MKRISLYIVVFVFASIDNPFGADLPEHSSVGIYALASAGHEFEPTLLYVDKMGFRIYVSEKVSIDFAGGLTFLSGRKNDTTALGRMETPPRNQYKIESGIIYDMWGSSIHAIGLYGRAGILKYTGVSYASDSTYTINKAITYDYIRPYLAAGFEPSYYFSKHFAIFSQFGLLLEFLPNTKYLDKDDGSYDWEQDVFPIKERKNTGQAMIRTSTLNLGVRYYF